MAVELIEKRRLSKEIIEAAKEVTKLGGGHYRFVTFGEGGSYDSYGIFSGRTSVGSGRLRKDEDTKRRDPGLPETA